MCMPSVGAVFEESPTNLGMGRRKQQSYEIEDIVAVKIVKNELLRMVKCNN